MTGKEKASVLTTCYISRCMPHAQLARNNWAKHGVIYNGDGEEINWEYLVKLHELQESEGVHMANKLGSAHIDRHQQKMKVNQAARSLSSSVADALDYCSDQLGMDAFSHCQAATKFIRTFDHIIWCGKFTKSIIKKLQSSIVEWHQEWHTCTVFLTNECVQTCKYIVKTHPISLLNMYKLVNISTSFIIPYEWFTLLRSNTIK